MWLYHRDRPHQGIGNVLIERELTRSRRCSSRRRSSAGSDSAAISRVTPAPRSPRSAQRPGPDLLVHSDRGCQYTGAEYRQALADRRAVVSYSRKGNCWDNAPMESFFATLKKDFCTG